MKKDIFGCKNALAHLAAKPDEARRKDSKRDDDSLVDLMDPYLADIDKILKSKSYRRLGSKTQVYTGVLNAHVRLRNSHSMEVCANAVAVANILGLNVPLCQAIAIGHDLGHTPFGHAGESFITSKFHYDRLENRPTFRHEIFGVIVCQFIERNGMGLNLTYQTLKGILNHSRGKEKAFASDGVSEEANVVMLVDKITYMLGDYSDIFWRMSPGIAGRIPLIEEFGKNQRAQTWHLIAEICKESSKEGKVSFCHSEAAQKFEAAKKKMYSIYEKVNLHNANEILGRVHSCLEKVAHDEFNPLMALALMTDGDVLYLNSLPCLSYSSLKETSVWELLPMLRKNNELSLLDPQLNW